jgi:hypothetical protein
LNPRHPDPQSEHAATQDKPKKAVTLTADSGRTTGRTRPREEPATVSAPPDNPSDAPPDDDTIPDACLTADEFLAAWRRLPASVRRDFGNPAADEMQEVARLWPFLPTVIRRILVSVALTHG